MRRLSSFLLVAVLSSSPTFALDDCDDLTAGLIAGCPSVREGGGIQNEDSSVGSFLFANNCDDSVRLAVRYRNLDGDWVSRGWWEAEPGEKFYLSHRGRKLSSDNAIWFYYAECLNKSCQWEGDHPARLRNRQLMMRSKRNPLGDNSWGIKCVAD